MHHTLTVEVLTPQHSQGQGPMLGVDTRLVFTTNNVKFFPGGGVLGIDFELSISKVHMLGMCNL